jgi:hypothetical protein
MSSQTYLYRVEIPLSTKINATVTQDEFLEENILLLHESTNEQHKLLARASDWKPELSDCLINSLILEASFVEKQDVQKLFESFKQRLNQYLYTVRYVAYEDSATLIEREAVVKEYFCNEEQSYKYSQLVLPQSSGHLKQIHFFTKEDFNFILNAASGKLEKYISLYVDASKLTDPVARLIGLASLCELIEQEMGSSAIIVAPLAKSARNLVAHGVVDKPNTLTPLNNHFNTTNQQSYVFSRNNIQHIDLVKWAASEYASYIETFLANQIPTRNISITMNSRQSV